MTDELNRILQSERRNIRDDLWGDVMDQPDIKEDQNQVVDVPLDEIEYDPAFNGGREINASDKLALADSIFRAGRLFSPLVIFKDRDEDNGVGITKPVYHILSGNKRYNAWLLLNDEYTDKGWERKDTIPCFIIPKPESEKEIAYQQLIANLGRKSDQDLDTEATLAKNLWESYTKEEKKKFFPTLRNIYEQLLIPSDVYAKLKEENRVNEYVRQNFRPSAMFVWMITGESGSYSSIRRTLAKINKESVSQDVDVMPDIEEKPKRAKKEKRLTIKSVRKQLRETADILESYYTDPQRELTDEVNNLIAEIRDYLASIQ